MTREEKVKRAQALRERGLLLREIGAEMGVSLKTVHTWLSDPDLSRQRARRVGYRGTCDTCGGPTDGSKGSGKAPARCSACMMWTPEAILEALRDWGDDHGGIPPRCADTRTGGEGHGRLPNDDSVKVVFGSWNAGLLAAGFALHMDKRPETLQAMADAIRAGTSTADVADMFGVSVSAVYMRLNYHGMKISELRKAA